MPPSLHSAVATDWPTTESRLGTPNFCWLLVGLFFGIGLCRTLRLVTRAATLGAADWYATAVISGASIAFASIALPAVIADTPGVPLLNDVTPADWERERRAAKLREFGPTDGFM